MVEQELTPRIPLCLPICVQRATPAPGSPSWAKPGKGSLPVCGGDTVAPRRQLRH